MSVRHLLADTGLETHEVALYLALVEEGEAPAGRLSKKSGVPRTYAYPVLEALVNKGLVRRVETRSIRHYAITDFEAPRRYLEKKQFEYYQAHQKSQSLSVQLENLAKPQAPLAIVEQLKDSPGQDDFWRLLHSTITREVWVINPPIWWGNPDYSSEVKKWEQFRQKQHIWEKRFVSAANTASAELKFTEVMVGKVPERAAASLLLVDNHQLQITSWEPFRAVRIESGEMVEIQKSMLA